MNVAMISQGRKALCRLNDPRSSLGARCGCCIVAVAPSGDARCWGSDRRKPEGRRAETTRRGSDARRRDASSRQDRGTQGFDGTKSTLAGELRPLLEGPGTLGLSSAVRTWPQRTCLSGGERSGRNHTARPAVSGGASISGLPRAGWKTDAAARASGVRGPACNRDVLPVLSGEVARPSAGATPFAGRAEVRVGRHSILVACHLQLQLKDPLSSGCPHPLWFWTANMFDQSLVGRRLYPHGLVEATMEQSAAMLRSPAIETEGVLVDVVVKMLRTDIALMRAQQPAFEEAGDTVTTRQQVLPHRLILSDDLTDEPHRLEPGIALQSVRADHATRRYHRLYGRPPQRSRSSRISDTGGSGRCPPRRVARQSTPRSCPLRRGRAWQGVPRPRTFSSTPPRRPTCRGLAAPWHGAASAAKSRLKEKLQKKLPGEKQKRKAGASKSGMENGRVSEGLVKV